VKLFIDTNVVLDVLAQRHPWFDDSAHVLAHIEQGRATGHIAAHTVTTLHNLLARHLTSQKTAAALIDLTALLYIEPVDHSILQQALTLGWRDFKTQCRPSRQRNARLITWLPATRATSSKAWFPS